MCKAVQNQEFDRNFFQMSIDKDMIIWRIVELALSDSH